MAVRSAIWLVTPEARNPWRSQHTSVAFPPDGQHVAADWNRTNVRLWEASRGCEELHFRKVRSIMDRIASQEQNLRYLRMSSDVEIWQR
jgi:hypothetical protein